MSNNTIPFADLERFLNDLGFAKTVVPGSHITFEQPNTGAVFLFRVYRPSEKVETVKLDAVRHLLVEKGLVRQEVFDRLLLKKPA